MQLARPAVANDPRSFGKRFPVERATERARDVAGDLKLFLATFACGFVFVSILIG